MNELIEMDVFTDRLEDTNSVVKTLNEDRIEITYNGYRQISAMCTEDYANKFTDRMYALGITLHALGY